jgi:hypothetical protein
VRREPPLYGCGSRAHECEEDAQTRTDGDREAGDRDRFPPVRDEQDGTWRKGPGWRHGHSDEQERRPGREDEKQKERQRR